MKQTDPWPAFGWTLDFLRAVHNRPRFTHWLLRLAVGRYAWRELCGMSHAIRQQGFPPENDYDLQGAGYHQEQVNLFEHTS